MENLYTAPDQNVFQRLFLVGSANPNTPLDQPHLLKVGFNH
jgi:hypothetical protein